MNTEVVMTKDLSHVNIQEKTERKWAHKAIYTEIIAYKTSQGQRH